MIRSLQLENFRLHAHTELRFDHDGQVILIAGANGAGKSTLLEAILFALYGESRHGRRNLDQLVRRGAELEGMSVELVFELGDDSYRINRRRDGRAVTAVLYGNEIPLVEGPLAVTEAVTRLLGMDSVGFKVAVIAQQKDLDGLASLRPAERSQTVRRLLRLDALTAAKEQAQGIFRHERDLVRDLRPSDVSDELRVAFEKSRTELETARAEHKRCLEALCALTAELDSTKDLDALWTAAVSGRDRASKAVEEAEAELARLDKTLSALVLPELVDVDADPDALLAEIADVERALARGEVAHRNTEQRRSVEAELARVDAALASLLMIDVASFASSVSAAESLAAARLDELATAEAALDESTSRCTAAETRLSEARARLIRVESLGASCAECGQSVTAAHRRSHTDSLAALLRTHEKELSREFGNSKQLRASRDHARVLLEQARAGVAAARQELLDAQRRLSERSELERRRDTYRSQLERLVPETVDLHSLANTRRELGERLHAARDAAQRREQHAVMSARREELGRVRVDVLSRLDSARVELESSSIDSELSRRHSERDATLTRRDDELALDRYWETETRLLEQRLSQVEEQIRRSAQTQARITAHQQRAVDAANAASLLSDAAERLATQIRPLLEGTMSQLLSQMSEGRFDTVQIDDEYNVTVSDAGAFRQLSELSGGEVDLVALALRLALSQAVADRAGAAAGFLILDECFGSQDPTRRASVLAALRGLRETYHQILLISHVENIEDAADVVLTVATSEDRSEAGVVAS